MIHQATTDFINLYHSELGKWDDKRIAYEKAEEIWIERHGKRKHRSYAAFRDILRKVRIRPSMEHPKMSQRRQNLHFIEIYNFVSDPYLMARDNYEAAEAIYMSEYGTRKFKNFKGFVDMRYDYTRNGLIRKTA